MTRNLITNSLLANIELIKHNLNNNISTDNFDVDSLSKWNEAFCKRVIIPVPAIFGWTIGAEGNNLIDLLDAFMKIVYNADGKDYIDLALIALNNYKLQLNIEIAKLHKENGDRWFNQEPDIIF